MDFDYKYSDKTIEYGIISGDGPLVLIKAGANGSCYGFDNKYLNIAQELHQRFNVTVICSSNPADEADQFSRFISFAKNYADKSSLNYQDIYYIGHSNGAHIGIVEAYKYPEIKKVLAINAPLMMNWHKLLNGLKNIQEQEFHLVYGTLDPSYKYYELLKPLSGAKVKLYLIERADHNFKELPEVFLKLPVKILFKEVNGK